MRRMSVMVGTIALLALTGGVSAEANTLTIQVTGLDLVFSAGTIHDTKDLVGGVGEPDDADPLASMNFFVDGVPVGSLSSNIWADVGLAGIGAIPVGGGTAQVQGGFFDLITKDPPPGQSGFGLALALNSMTLTYTGTQITLSSTSAEIIEQALPFALGIDQPIQVVFILSVLTGVTDNGVRLTGFTGSGTGTVSGTALPEPATLLLLGAGMLGVSLRARRRFRDR